MKGFDKNKFKKQVISGGIYIALAAAVVAVTLNGVNNIIGNTDYEIPETNFDLSQIHLKNPSYDIEIKKDISIKDGNNITLENTKENMIPDDSIFLENNVLELTTDINILQNDQTFDSTDSYVSGDGEKVSAETIDITEVEVSGEPDGIEYPTEPDPTTYGFYAKPADGYIDKEYSDDNLLYSVTMGDYRTHNGIDITGDLGSSVRSINAGVVTDVYYDDFYGYTVVIDHGNGIQASYMNLSESLPASIKTGSKVELGQVIGGIGNSASVECAEVSHLHLSVKNNGEYIDPRELLRNNY